MINGDDRLLNSLFVIFHQQGDNVTKPNFDTLYILLALVFFTLVHAIRGLERY
jgi:ACR3 family arsenite efflux pump ArsB